MTNQDKIVFWVTVAVAFLVAAVLICGRIVQPKSGATSVATNARPTSTAAAFAQLPSTDTGIEITSTALAAAQPANVFRLASINQDLGAIPASVFQMTNLVSLNLADTGLTSVPAEIGDMKNLQVLYLDGNPKLVSLPDQIGNLPNLRILSLYNDGLTGLPAGVMRLPSLAVLGLSGNPLPTSTVKALKAALPNVKIN